MRILVVSPYVGHPRAGHGGGEYLYGLLEHLSKSNEVTFVSFANEQERALARDLTALPITVRLIPRRKGRQKSLAANITLSLLRAYQLVRSFLLWQPYYVSKFYHPAMVRLITNETRNQSYDIVQLEYAQMGQYARHVRNGKTVLRAHDVVFRPAYRNFRRATSVHRKCAMYIEWCRWARYEPMMVRICDHVLTFTEQDAALLKRLSSIDHVSYNSIGMFVPDSVVPYGKRDRNVLLFVGVFDHSPNVDAAIWLCSEIFPRVKERCAHARLIVVGRNPPRSLRAVAGAHPSIELAGFVPSLDHLYRTASVFVAPILSGGGIKTKIINAQMHGLPVVTTPLGAEGIEGAGPSTLVVGRTGPDIANGIITLLNDRERASRLAETGRMNALNCYSLAVTTAKQEKFYRSLLDS